VGHLITWSIRFFDEALHQGHHGTSTHRNEEDHDLLLANCHE
jgi:hypothetical protein